MKTMILSLLMVVVFLLTSQVVLAASSTGIKDLIPKDWQQAKKVTVDEVYLSYFAAAKNREEAKDYLDIHMWVIPQQELTSGQISNLALAKFPVVEGLTQKPKEYYGTQGLEYLGTGLKGACFQADDLLILVLAGGSYPEQNQLVEKTVEKILDTTNLQYKMYGEKYFSLPVYDWNMQTHSEDRAFQIYLSEREKNWTPEKFSPGYTVLRVSNYQKVYKVKNDKELMSIWLKKYSFSLQRFKGKIANSVTVVNSLPATRIDAIIQDKDGQFKKLIVFALVKGDIFYEITFAVPFEEYYLYTTRFNFVFTKFLAK